MYRERQSAQTLTRSLRGNPCHLRCWGPDTSPLPPLVLLHGWMDVGASWQFVVDAFSEALSGQRRIIAPDWRGFGLSMPASAVDCYHFSDYLADLDALLHELAGEAAIDLVGHSMGGNLAMMYAGVRPARIRRLVNLEGFGLPATDPAEAPARYAQWLDELQRLRQGEIHLKSYDSADKVAARLMRTNPRLGADKAAWLAQHWARQGADGRWHVLGDAAHKVVSAQLYRVDEALALYAAITAPVLCIESEQDSPALWFKGRFTLREHHQRLTHVRQLQTATVQDAGHMLHHDQPAVVARLIEDFLGA
ncbi:alpha/beta fold hydrolase [Comamonas sp. NLF-1-9]|uniref:alpha/beta fold hydrolase n=1 Tax=Comamonas sp. NLF-1-9 TaxID=2853163 RepID=UPI001C445706|nr:alpha/beta hydrolase [Comamonas sp. NLF-1-9]QXL85701.1 alpha/beta hydrolase [Comamonas sp. NLF-1-9]